MVLSSTAMTAIWIILGLMLFIGITFVISIFLYMLLQKSKGPEIPIDAVIARSYDLRLTKGYGLVLVIQKYAEKYGRVKIRAITLDNPYNNKGIQEPPIEIVFCCRSSKFVVYPKSTLSAFRMMADIFPSRSNNLPMLVRNAEKGFYSDMIENINTQDHSFIAIEKSLDQTIRAFFKHDRAEVLEAFRNEVMETIKSAKNMSLPRHENVILDAKAKEVRNGGM